MKTSDHYYCKLPWTGFSNDPDGKVRPCCLFKDFIKDENNQPMYVQKYSVNEIFQSKYMKDLRQQFRNGEKPSPCSTCWTDEANGIKSKRQTYSDTVMQFDLEPTAPNEYQMIINNSCNLKCRSCTPSHSTQWQAEFKALTGNTGYPMLYKQAGDEDGKLWTNREEWYATLLRLEIVGGEPFYVKQWQQVFDELIASGRSKEIAVSLSTNCTLFYPKLVEKLVANFNQIGIGLSIDGIGSTFEYLRHLGNWDTVNANMQKYHDMQLQHKNIRISVSITSSWLNAFDLPKLHTLINTEFPKFAIWNNIIHYPEHMALWAIPNELKSAIESNWKDYNWASYRNDINGIIKYMHSREISPDQFAANIQKIKQTDEFRKENLLNSIPTMRPFIEEYYL